jgi:hypothetical protein
MAGFLYKKTSLLWLLAMEQGFDHSIQKYRVLITIAITTEKGKAAGRNARSGQFVSYFAGISALYNAVSSFCINTADTPAEP